MGGQYSNTVSDKASDGSKLCGVFPGPPSSLTLSFSPSVFLLVALFLSVCYSVLSLSVSLFLLLSLSLHFTDSLPSFSIFLFYSFPLSLTSPCAPSLPVFLSFLSFCPLSLSTPPAFWCFPCRHPKDAHCIYSGQALVAPSGAA